VSEDEATRPPGPRQHVEAGRDVYAAVGNIVFQNPSQSPEAAALKVRSASEGADLLIGLSTDDETLGRARTALTGVSTSVAAPALRMLLGRDKDLAIALLASIPEARAETLVTAMGSHGTGLQELLTAIEAVNECESTAGSVIGKRAGRFMRTSSARGTQGFLQRYANGAIHWTPGHGALATTGEIAGYHYHAGGSEGPLGFPVAAEVQAAHPRTKTKCSWQLFEGPSDYSPEVCAFLNEQCGATVISSQKHGTYATWGGIGEFSELGWRDRGEAGLPVDDMVAVGPSRRKNGTGTSGWSQRFEYGTVYYCDKAGAIRVPGRWADYLKSRGGVASSTGFPVSPIMNAAASPYGTTGNFQRFEGFWDYPEEIVGCWSDRERPGGATIYHSKQHGAHTVERGNGTLYERLDGTASWLGFPTSDETHVKSASGPERTIQWFEGGAIFYTPKYHSIPVKREILDHTAEHPHINDQLGFPISEAEPLASTSSSYIQFFEHGVVTVRDNLVQVWLDPSLHL
jgi:uncharacterized protein with LGFP repeats